MEDYGLALKKLRKYFGYTQADLAARIGVTNQAVSKWENGINQPDISMLRSICAILGITTEQFFRVAAGEEVETVLGLAEAVEESAAADDVPPAAQPVQIPRKNNKVLWISVLSAATAILLAAMVLLIIFLPKKPILDGIEKVQISYYLDGKLYRNEELYEGGTPPTPEKEGYEFVGWYTHETSGTPFNFNDFPGKEKVTLYARFQAERYSILFTSSLHDTTFQKQVSYGEAWAFPTDGFTHSDFNLIGWTGYGTTYALGARGVDLNALDEAATEFTFRAKWESKEPIVPPDPPPVMKYQVSFTDGARGGGNLSYANYDTTEIWTLPACNVSYEGYTFKNWYCTQTKAYYSAGTKVKFEDGENKEFVAQWTPITYTVKYESELHDAPFYREYSYGRNYTIPSSLAISKEGYLLLGWEINGSMYEPNEIFCNLTTRGEELTATAVWQRTLYWIYVEYPYKESRQFGPYDWEESVAMPSADTFTPPNGYVFDCWVRKKTGEEYAAGQMVSKLPDPVFDDYIISTQSGYKVKFEVRWKTVAYTVNFLGNGATGGNMQPQSFQANEMSRLNKNAFTKDGYLFAGWEAPTLYFNGDYSGKWDATSYYGDVFVGSLDGYFLNENRIYNFATAATEFDFKARWVKALQGAGTSSNPYLIRSIEDLQALSYLIDNHVEMRTAHYKLTTDLTFTNKLVRAIGFYTSAQGAESIGFAGVFDGDGHILKNITYDSQTNQPVSTTLEWNYETFALFGYVAGGTVKNLGVFGGNTVYAGQRFGGIVGRLDGGGVLERCGVNISSSLEYRETKSTCLGGIANEVWDGTVRDCYVFGTMVGTYYTNNHLGEVRMGGLVAAAKSGAVVERCYTNVSIHVDVSQSTRKARHYLGGLIGDAEYCTVKNCFVGGYLYARTYSDFTGLIIGYSYYMKAYENLYWESYNGGMYLEPLDAGIQGTSSKIGSAKTFNELYSMSWLTSNMGFDDAVWQQEDMAFPTLKVLAGNLK